MKRILEQQTETGRQGGRMQEPEDGRESDSVAQQSFVKFNAAFTKDFSTKP